MNSVTENSGRSILTVAQISNFIKNIIDSTPFLNNVRIKGEISNFTNHYKTGHYYFTLKDDGGTLQTVMFKGSAVKLPFMPENGMKVIVSGRISVYQRDGRYVMYAADMEPDGIGALYLAFEQLKRRLADEGYFNEAHKLPLPKIPLRIGVITSPTGAAVRDIINITGRRFPFAEIILFPSLVQGADAPPQLIEGIRVFNLAVKADLIIIGRGGGSIEDLWAFNNEELVLSIYNSKVPVISAVGHETDFTLCDFAADKRAPTPSAAAELAVPDTLDLQRKINNIVGRMELLLGSRIDLHKQHLKRMSEPMEMLICGNLNLKRQRLKRAAEARVLTSPENTVSDKRMAVLSAAQRLDSSMKYILQNKRGMFERDTARLNALNPLSIISRGYSAVFKRDGTLIKSVKQLDIGDEFTFKTSDGNVLGEVREIHGE